MKMKMVMAAVLLAAGSSVFSVQASDTIVRNAPVSEFVYSMATAYGFSVALDPKLVADQREVSVFLPPGAEPEEVFYQMLKALGYDLCPGSVRYIVPAENYGYPVQTPPGQFGGRFHSSVSSGDSYTEFRAFPISCGGL